MASDAEVMNVKTAPGDSVSYRFDVTVRHPDTR